MALDLSLPLVSALLGGVLLIVLGVWLAVRRPSRAETLFVAAYAGFFGVSYVPVTLLLVFNAELEASHASWVAAAMTVSSLASVGSAAGVVALVILYSRPTTPGNVWTLLVPAGLALSLAIHVGLQLSPSYRSSSPVFRATQFISDPIYALSNVSFGIFIASLWFALLVAGLKVQGADGRDARASARWIALSAGVSLYILLRVGLTFARLAQEGLGYLWIESRGMLHYAAQTFVLLLATLALWTRFFISSGRAGAGVPGVRRATGAIVMFFLAALLAGEILPAAFPGDSTFRGPTMLANGLSMILSTSILAYAILRHQMFGLDVKLRWTMSKATLAAIFIATFFIAGEAAQQFFGERLGGPYIGILAAGSLVFAITPLSRLADRLSMRAIPSAAENPASRADSAEAAYGAAVRLALRAGITRAEEFELARIAESHRISATRALELRVREEDAAERKQAGAREPRRRKGARS